MSKSAKEMFIEQDFQCTIDNDEEIDFKLHQAINKQVEELR